MPIAFYFLMRYNDFNKELLMKNQKFDFVVRTDSSNNYVLFKHFVKKGLFNKYKHKDICVENENIVVEYNIELSSHRGYIETQKPNLLQERFSHYSSVESLLLRNTDIVGINEYAELLNFIKTCSESDFLKLVKQINEAKQKTLHTQEKNISEIHSTKNYHSNSELKSGEAHLSNETSNSIESSSCSNL